MIKVRYFLVRLFKETTSTSIRWRQLWQEDESAFFAKLYESKRIQ